jgi:hypothetical protein
MGYAAAGAGDVDGDGLADFIIGAYQYDCGQINEGVAVVFLGRDVTASADPGQKIGMPGGGCSEVRQLSVKRKAAAALMVLLIITGAGLLVLRRVVADS